MSEINITQISEKLKASPIFNMSLSSKELFHSNFISWIITKFPQILSGMFADFLELRGEWEIRPDTVYREKRHIDLLFKIESMNGNKLNIVIENKVKSLPYLRQLTNYSGKFDESNSVFVLLSLSTPYHLFNEDRKIVDRNGNEWKLLNYSNFAYILLKAFKKSEHKIDPYHFAIINDYISFLQLLSEIDCQTELSSSEKFNWYDSELPMVLNELRLDDFYIKKKCENMAHYIFKELSVIASENGVLEDQIDYSSSIVQGTNGEFRFYYAINNRIGVSIEVSKMYYRKMLHITNQYKDDNKVLVELSPVYKSDPTADYFDEKLNWFDFKYIMKQDGKYKARKKYNKFWTTRYRQCRLTADNTVDEILDYFKRDFSHILKHKELIIQNFA